MKFINFRMDNIVQVCLALLFLMVSPILLTESKSIHSQVLSPQIVENLVETFNSKIGASFPWLEKYEPFVTKYSRKFDIDKNLVYAVIQSESSGRPDVVSPVGAMGLMQLAPLTAEMLEIHRPFEPEHNIKGGVKYLHHLKKLYDGNHKKMLWAYNAGPGRVKIKHMPQETKVYISKVLNLYKYFTS